MVGLWWKQTCQLFIRHIPHCEDVCVEVCGVAIIDAAPGLHVAFWQCLRGAQTVSKHWWLVKQLSCIASAQHMCTVMQTVNGWNLELKKQLLQFWTGSNRLPQPLTEVLYIELPFVAFNRQEHMNMLTRLPQVRSLAKSSHDVPFCVVTESLLCLRISATAETCVTACHNVHFVPLLKLLGSESGMGHC